MDFQTQQHRLLPQVATAYALLAAGKNMMQFYLLVITDINKGAYSQLPQVGHQLFGVVSVVSVVVVVVIVVTCVN